MDQIRAVPVDLLRYAADCERKVSRARRLLLRREERLAAAYRQINAYRQDEAEGYRDDVKRRADEIWKRVISRAGEAGRR